MNNISNISVFCASSSVINKEYFQAATTLGKILGEHKLHVINGAGRMGLMRAIADSTMEAGGEAIGIIPQFMMDNGWGYDKMTHLEVVESMHERKQRMADLSDGTIALPGGCGTMEELLEVITWKQLGLYPKPIVILNTLNYFNPLLEMLKRGIDEQFMRPLHAQMWSAASTPEEAYEMLLNQPEWPKNYNKYAKI